MPRTLELRDDGLAVGFRGLVRLGTLRRGLVVPWSAVRAVAADPYELDPAPLAPVAPRLSRAAHGRFRRAGRWLFLSFEDPCRVVRLQLDRRAAGFDEVVLGHREPAALAAAIAARAGLSPAALAA